MFQILRVFKKKKRTLFEPENNSYGPHFLGEWTERTDTPAKDVSCGVMVWKLAWQILIRKFDSHWLSQILTLYQIELSLVCDKKDDQSVHFRSSEFPAIRILLA